MGKKITTRIMGILNVTPDSFSDGGLFFDPETAIIHAEKMMLAGADIIDVGGESTRPGSDPVSLQEEMDRVMPVLEQIVSMDVKVSIDTTKPEIALEALRIGADMVNDISGLQYDPRIAEHVARHGAQLIIMHMKGVPKTMQKDIPYGEDIIREIRDFFRKQTKMALDTGINKKNIILDPGIGFGKRLEDNTRIIREIDDLKSLGFPLMVGASRKSMIGDISKAKTTDRLPGSLAIACVAALRGVDIIRVHDVPETVQAFKVLKEIW